MAKVCWELCVPLGLREFGQAVLEEMGVEAIWFIGIAIESSEMECLTRLRSAVFRLT